MIRGKSAGFVPLTRELGKKHFNMPHLIGERPFIFLRGKELIAEIEAGTFAFPTWVIAIHNGKEYRADGQHTSYAVVHADKDVPEGSQVLIVYYELDNLKEDAANLFMRIDDRDAARNPVATMNCLAVQHPDLQNLKTKFIIAVVNGIVYHLKAINKRQKDPEQRVKIHKAKLRGWYLTNKSYRVFIQWLDQWNHLKDRKTEQPRKALNEWLMHKPVLVAAAMSHYFEYSEAAKVFWDDIFDDSGLKGQATKELVSLFNEWQRRPNRARIPKPEQWGREVNRVWKEFRVEYDKVKIKKKAS